MTSPEKATVRYPEIVVKLTGKDSNIFNIIAKGSAALRHAGVPKITVDEYVEEAMDSESYSEALHTIMQWVTVK